MLQQEIRGRAHSLVLIALGPALLPAAGGEDKGKELSSLTHATVQPTRGGPALPCSHLCGWQNCNLHNQGQFYCVAQERCRDCSPACCRWQGVRGEGISLSPMSLLRRQVAEPALPCSCPYGAALPAPWLPGSALGKVMHLVRGRDSFPASCR